VTGFDSERDGLPDWNLDDEAPAPPGRIEPVPATVHRDLRGRRVIVGLPGLGWRGDLRADSPVVQGSRTYVPVLPEHEWYRAEAEQIEVFAPLVPIERVWVETVGEAPAPNAPPGDLVSRLVSLDAPPARVPVPVRDIATVTGRRVVKQPGPDEKASGERRGLRAVTEPYSSTSGDICVRVTTELDWYRWAWSGKNPKTLEVPTHLLWVE
jgi:hypothetical protein